MDTVMVPANAATANNARKRKTEEARIFGFALVGFILFQSSYSYESALSAGPFPGAALRPGTSAAGPFLHRPGPAGSSSAEVARHGYVLDEVLALAGQVFADHELGVEEPAGQVADVYGQEAKAVGEVGKAADVL